MLNINFFKHAIYNTLKNIIRNISVYLYKLLFFFYIYLFCIVEKFCMTELIYKNTEKISHHKSLKEKILASDSKKNIY